MRRSVEWRREWSGFANFDLGMLVGSPVVGAAAGLWGYGAAFYLAAGAALACAAISYSMSRQPLAVAPGRQNLAEAPAPGGGAPIR